MTTKWTQDSIILKLKELHPNLDFSKFIFTKVDNKGIVICPTRGPIFMKAMNLLRGCGCKLCRPQSQKRTPEQIIQQFNEKHSNKYKYPNFQNYINSKQIIDIICPEHGLFTQQIIHHTNGCGCLKCHDRSFNRKDLDYHVSLIPSVISKYLKCLDIIFKNGQSYLKLLCKRCNEEDLQETYRCKQHDTCKNCNRIEIESKGIRKIKNILSNLNISYISEKTFSDCINPQTNYKLRFDIFIEALNLCIEFDGPQHFIAQELYGGEEELIRTQYRDNIKNEYCKNKNINLIRISYKDKNIEEILNERLKKYEQL